MPSWGTLLIAPSPEDVRRRREKVRRAKKIRERIERDALTERRLLEYVVSKPETSSKGAYRALGLNDTDGGTTRDILRDKGFIQVVERRSEKGRVLATKLFITPEGETYLQQLQKEG